MNFSDHGISQRDLAALASCITPYREQIDQVILFGSRATGRYTSRSDIDLLIHGTLQPIDLIRLRLAFEESEVTLRVDLVRFQDADDALRTHVEQFGKPLSFS